MRKCRENDINKKTIMQCKIYVISLPGKCERELLLWTLGGKTLSWNKLQLPSSAAHQCPLQAQNEQPPLSCDQRAGRTFWAGMASGLSKTIRGSALCTQVYEKTFENEVKGKRKLLFSGPLSHLRCVCCITSLQQELRPQCGGEALRQRVAVLACHDQMEGRAELGEVESSVPVHVTQLPETQEEMRSLQVACWNYSKLTLQVTLVYWFRFGKNI